MGGVGGRRDRHRREREAPRHTTRMDEAEAHVLTAREVRASLQSGEVWLGRTRWLDESLRIGTRRGVAHQMRRVVITKFAWYGGVVRTYAVPVAWVPQPFGGVRAWLVCGGCGRLRRTLFIYGVPAFRCRVCERLCYPSQRLTRRKRALHRREQIGRRMCSDWDEPRLMPERPKGMHRRTYARLVAAWRDADAGSKPQRRRSPRVQSDDALAAVGFIDDDAADDRELATCDRWTVEVVTS